MLNTIKYIKLNLDFRNRFSWLESGWNYEKQQKIETNEVKEQFDLSKYSENINKWLEQKSQEPWFKNNLWDLQNRFNLEKVNSLASNLWLNLELWRWVNEEIYQKQFNEKMDVLNKFFQERNLNIVWANSRRATAEDFQKLNASQQYWNEANKNFFNASKTNLNEVWIQLDKTLDSVMDLNERISLAEEINKSLVNYDNLEKDGYSIETLLRKVLNKDKYNEITKLSESIVKNKEQFEQLLNAPGWKDKLERAIQTLRQTWDVQNNWEKSGLDMWWLFWHFMKALPWAAWIYVWDVTLPFVKDLAPWADISKTKAFRDWINNWMNWEFSDYASEHKPENIWVNQWKSIDMLSRLKLKPEEKADILSGKINNLTEETKNTLSTYFDKTLLPSLEKLWNDSFNIFDKVFDEKSKKFDNLIKEMKEWLEKWDLKILDKAEAALKLIEEEWDTDISNIQSVRQWNDYINHVQNTNDVIGRRFSQLHQLWNSIINKYSRMLALTDLTKVKDFWAKSSEFGQIEDLAKIFENKTASPEELAKQIKDWEIHNGDGDRFISALQDDKSMRNYLLSGIPKLYSSMDWVKISKQWESQHWESQHWVALTWDNMKDLQEAKMTIPNGEKNISALWAAYRTFVTSWQLRWVSYQEFENAFANKHKLDISSLWDYADASIINTAKQEGKWRLTTFNQLAKERWDTHVFQLEPITKEYSYYSPEWNKVNVKMEYNLLIRPDCTNPIIWPCTIEATSNGEPVPEEKIQSMIESNGRLPIVIPWWVVFKKSGWGSWEKPKEPTPDNPPALDFVSNVWTKPGEVVFNQTASNFWAESWIAKVIQSAEELGF